MHIRTRAIIARPDGVSRVKAFAEDNDILEAQQRSLALDPLAPTVNVKGDWGGVQAWRMLKALIAKERPRILSNV